MGEFGLDNILGEQEIETLFNDPGSEEAVEEAEKRDEDVQTDNAEKEKKENDNTAEAVIDPEALFKGEDQEERPESVGVEKESGGKEKEEPSADNDDGASPNQNFYSSIAGALAEDGIFPNLTDDDVKKVNDAEGLYGLIEAEVNARFDEKQQRVIKALDNGAEPDSIRRYENTLGYISAITDAQLSEEGEKGEDLRRSLIYQDFINKGYSTEKARKFTERTIDAGTDIEDAKEALQSNREYFQKEYDRLLKDAQDSADKERAERDRQAEELKNSILNDKQLMGDMEIGGDVRRKALDAITKPVYKDPETGEYLTALQKYESEHRADFVKYAGLIYTMTNGFKDFDSFVKGKVKKEVRKGLMDLEKALKSNGARNSGGNLRMVGGSKESDDYSYLGKGFALDI